ncbi:MULTISPECIES: carboxymuconolactone decarboxylase family protein [Bacillus]|jgi:alkylhydroperoxidase/carboxymuconolactone decarboxylase family protein YurZ|uniref:carboxymuconolactone decarboxylase family protein n=1 Tax=Bacillus TaxID=1386 RepID=UPI000CDD7890|nr:MULTISPECIES: carboxymuconolactone decarboxylase family protein [Bacillus]AXC53660.1 carboxymuconolactone decarboxylase family protein [Bacillus spizizenii]MDF4197061.1 carboxymuconolactone decarboxylase family protein [Bacillus subtilis]MDF4218037.1 carboxymuconolactone decarboxylase family protein [Bacillus subtilis]MDK1005280.1 carboxymuconolactone decarboxylase family protein [Bacillus subtilis]POX32261.1 4-carboxymuconolactone decarboxylase [Bacillus sp. Ru63]
MTKNPAFEKFKEEFPDVFINFSELYKNVSSTLDEKTKQLVYLGILTAMRYAPAVRVHCRLALEAGATREEIKEAIMLAIPAGGLCNFLDVFEDAMYELNI